MLTYGMIGGGEGAFIGDVHRKAINLDRKAVIAAGSFSRDYEKTLAMGASLDIDRERLYETYSEMADREGKRENGIDFVVIVTPNNLHYSIAKIFLENGIHVVCDKPVTTNSTQAEDLQRLAKEKDLLFCVTYTYSGYPLITQAREMIRNNDIGDIRFVNAEFPEGWLAASVENKGDKQAVWRLDPAQSGASNCAGDLGSHVEHLVSYMTGLEIKSLCASLDICGEGRILDDNASIMVRYEGGAKGLYWTSYIAIGHDNGLCVRIYGTKGSIMWVQEDPNYLRVTYIDKPVQILSRGRDKMHPKASGLSRVPAGHPEGYFVAFANIYLKFLTALTKKTAGESLSEDDMGFPGIAEGLRGVQFVEHCVESSQKGTVWVDL
ncbi:MAG: Gfo/Idh/MocA family oxidoreductase [Bacteroidetes bacterium]|nr:Gfo/Idh/MocA family oxidoreductase [Bacteroidota bacterium]